MEFNFENYKCFEFSDEDENIQEEIKEDPNKWKQMELILKNIKGLNSKNTVSKKNIDQFIDNYIDEVVNSMKSEFRQAVNQELDKREIAQRLRAIYNKKLRTLAKYGNMEYHEESYSINDIIELWDNIIIK